nr:amidoligase family protein [Methylomarinum sp. Ch1-1]MDP4520072.1 amidoligase family protein [Methylomarinum sp. Ch1-1]
MGFELEFSGLSLEQTGVALRKSLGGKLEQLSVAESVLHVDALGDFTIELDWNYLKRTAEENEHSQQNGDWVNLLSQAANLLVPVEIACPPIPVGELEALTPMVDDLRKAGAVGTEESLLAAYGVHINPEIPRQDAETLFTYLRAFAVLQWWLVDAHDVDVTRKMSPYIDLYPEAYLKKLLSAPQPTMEQLFADYLEHNASRNRALDLLPLLAHIDRDAVLRVVDDPKIQARPTFHYRLPNCHIERADWSLSASWNTWWVVEQLASRSDDLNELSQDFLQAERPVIGVNRKEWVEYIGRWLKDHALA